MEKMDVALIASMVVLAPHMGSTTACVISAILVIGGIWTSIKD